MKDFNYPAPDGPYKVCVNTKAPWRQYSAARIQISIGKANYEGDKFLALCDWCRHRFDQTAFIVSDTLQRHNFRYRLGCDPASAWKIARIEGDKWLERNARSIHAVPDRSIIRWDELLDEQRFQPLPVSVALQRAIDCTIKEFWLRQGADGPSYDEFYSHSFAFLHEELSVFSDLFKRPAIDIYAGSWFQDLMAVQYPDKDYLSVDYTRNKGFHSTC